MVKVVNFESLCSIDGSSDGISDGIVGTLLPLESVRRRREEKDDRQKKTGFEVTTKNSNMQ